MAMEGLTAILGRRTVLIRQIEYDSYANLVRIGDRPPRAFPDGTGFTPDPPRP